MGVGGGGGGGAKKQASHFLVCEKPRSTNAFPTPRCPPDLHRLWPKRHAQPRFISGLWAEALRSLHGMREGAVGGAEGKEPKAKASASASASWPGDEQRNASGHPGLLKNREQSGDQQKHFLGDQTTILETFSWSVGLLVSNSPSPPVSKSPGLSPGLLVSWSPALLVP